MQTLAYGIFTWNSRERVSNRYGSFFLGAEPHPGGTKVTPTFNTTLGKSLEGKRVRVKALVKEARLSGHVGDLFLRIYPSMPTVGEEVELGVATLEINWERKLSDGVPTMVLRPGEPRDELWIDPRKLYRLHSQTVELLVEATGDAFTPAVVLTN